MFPFGSANLGLGVLRQGTNSLSSRERGEGGGLNI